jgi:hypothetical protein
MWPVVDDLAVVINPRAAHPAHKTPAVEPLPAPDDLIRDI